MAISLFDLFKIGIGPSSSHTVGPMRAANEWAQEILADEDVRSRLDDLDVHLYGSLAATGIGHGTLDAVILGLEGNDPREIDPVKGWERAQEIEKEGGLLLGGQVPVTLRPSTIVVHPLTFLPEHSNGMTFNALDADGEVIATRTSFSVGGGFVLTKEEINARGADAADEAEDVNPIFTTGAELLRVCEEHGISISQAMMWRERQWRSEEEVRAGALEIWAAMDACITAGMHTPGVLPGGLNVKRRAAGWYESLQAEDPDKSRDSQFDWVSLAALAVNEENAAGGRVVTAPTNGAAGIIPAVLFYALNFLDFDTQEEKDDAVVRFLLAAAAVGSLYKENASISGAEVGCQGEVGSASSMAAAGLAEVMGAKPPQVENAAEIAMEHNLGLTCDPVGGLVQIPCIERNAMGSIKAITAVRFALRGNGEHLVSLDTVIETMRRTGKDMNERYKETAMGGLAITVPVSLPEC
ncbi:L-serine ammonia-lyase [Helcobacillus massiliensis]|uniref:L-serine ammonia-lyase n=1 Tax=Helcobacillus massiliensis TaxID=521392 RepID=UPI002557B895|nr:L-serine ammonia-lyase [Helcobacillus massiliensis]MDK7742342.1 L-serine ammonia-lyase [Helcobacillus massiliensis]WOO92022.1 L-serine ammonia-lyase [Helcobacillus massiliensis]